MTPTAEQKAAAQERRARVRELARTIAAMPEEKRAALAAKVPVVTIDGHAISPINCCLIAMQGGGHATIVAGFKQWLDNGRAVRKGERGFSIWCPKSPKKQTAAGELEENSDDNKMSFFLVSVFDVAQTEELEAKV